MWKALHAWGHMGCGVFCSILLWFLNCSENKVYFLRKTKAFWVQVEHSLTGHRRISARDMSCASVTLFCLRWTTPETKWVSPFKEGLFVARSHWKQRRELGLFCTRNRTWQLSPNIWWITLLLYGNTGEGTSHQRGTYFIFLNIWKSTHEHFRKVVI